MAVKPVQHLSLDVGQQLSFIQYFNSLPKIPATTVRFFNRTDYYTTHGVDATLAAKEVFRTTSFIKKIGSGDELLETMILNKSQFEAFVRDLLLVKHYRVEVYINRGSKTAANWSLDYKGSPGNLTQFEDLLFMGVEQVEGSGVVAVKLGGDSKNRLVGLAAADCADCCFSVCEFADDECFTSLEALIVQLGPKECLLPCDASPEMENVKKVLSRSGVLMTGRKRTEFSHDGLVQDLNRLIAFTDGQQQNANTLPQIDMVTAIAALAAIIKYLELCSDKQNFKQFRLVTLDHGRFVKLDTAAVHALSLLPTPGAPPHHSVLGLLDRCRTPQGHRLLSQWVKQPLRDLATICERHDIVEWLLNDTELRQALHEEHLRRVPDLQALAKRLTRKKATMQDCYRIYQAVERLPSLVQALVEGRGEDEGTANTVILGPLRELTEDMAKFQEMIESTMDMTLVDRGEFLIKPQFDQDLQGLREQMDELERETKAELNRVARDLGLETGKSVKLESNAQHGYFFRVTLKDEQVLRNNKRYTQLDTNKAGVRFRSRQLEQLNTDYLEAREQYQEHQKAVVAEVISIAGGYAGPLHQLSRTLAQLDVLTSFAAVAASAPKPYIRPTMLASGGAGEGAPKVLTLTAARHPCLEMQDSVSYIANDIDLKQGERTLSVVTGPNMGGKSTYIRSAGVVALMAHIGSLVPCSAANISLLDAILVRVGASDCQIKGMSTFMVEMVETASILRTATENSLVIIDELGRGTSTFEGCGIAWAIAEHLAKETKSFCLFATHFHELTRLSEALPAVHNLHVSAVTMQDALTLLYQVKAGACDQSFGIHVAGMARFPQRTIQAAKRKLSELEDYQGMLQAGNEETERQKIFKEGEQIMEEMVAECKALADSGLSEAELMMRVESLKQAVLARGNPYIGQLVRPAA